nr:two-component sensor histidine kinase [Nitrosopumilaceae archaeon]NIT99427.1 two-component sensor histidine kinase [Nitrosopumilaceae archaeon]NIU85788.1 two-component sensor histidine kinase [Nitrosopumilaceae archaeon]NIX60030.1 two-component sensor histidine kinase [Nitrosopumilaceae archaeon]
MKIISKTYLLIAILIAVAVINLFLLYQEGQISSAQSYSIIRAGDLKVKAESIASIATSIASGNIQEKSMLQKEIQEFQSNLNVLKTGGEIDGQSIRSIHHHLTPE